MHTVSSSRLVLGGKVRITAVAETPAEVGRPLVVTFRIRNVSRQPRRIQLDYATSLWLVIRGADGTKYDTRKAVALSGSFGGPMRLPTSLRPGQTVARRGSYLRVRWSGPLRITPGWNRTALPSLHIAVTTPQGPVPSGRASVADVVDASGHLLDHCRPQRPGIAVTGRIDAPKQSAPPLQVRCSVSLRRERGFLVAQLLAVTTPGPRGARLHPTYEEFEFPRPGGNATVIGWQFVVTRDGATSVGSSSMESTRPANRMAPDWQWTTSGWKGRPGGSRCGGTGGGGGGYEGPFVEFVSVCARGPA